jgi:hypothetical protein
MANCLPPSSLYPRSAMEDECINGMVGRKIRQSAVGIGFAASSAATFGMPRRVAIGSRTGGLIPRRAAISYARVRARPRGANMWFAMDG